MNNRQLSATVPLNAGYLEARAAELGLKQWWLAEQVGVSGRTMLRWFNGQVARVEAAHVDRLAALLDCAPEALIQRGAAAFASPADQADAARLIAEERLLDVLTPTSSYELAESLIKAVLRPEVPKAVLGRLYALLALAAGRQFALERAREYAALATAIGEELASPGIVAAGRHALGWALLYGGDCAAGAVEFAAAAETFAALGSRRDEGNARFALGCAVCYLGRGDEALAGLREAVALLADQDCPVDESMALYALAAFTSEAGDAAGAAALFERSLAAAAGAGYGSGVEKARAGLAWTHAQRGDLATATALFAETHRNTRGWSFVHPLTFLYGARIAAKAGDPVAARGYVGEGLRHAEKFAPERAALERELAALRG